MHFPFFLRKFSSLSPSSFLLYCILALFGAIAIALFLPLPTTVSMLDTFFQQFIVSQRTDALTGFFTGLTFFGGTLFLTSATLIMALFLFFRKSKALIAFLLAIGGSAVFTKLAKISFGRERPEIGLIEETSYSFPSGHTANSTAFYGFLAFLLFTRLQRRWQRIALLVGTSLFLIFMGLSRVYLGVHFTSDVIGGYLMGGFWLTLALWIYRRTA